MSSEKIKLILAYSSDRDDFFPIEGEELDAKNNTYLIIDELEEKSTLSFPEQSSLIQKRTIERRVSSYLKVGYPVGAKGLRIGANFPLEKIGVGEVLPEILMTHGHSFGKSRLKRDEIPDYVEKGDTYDVIPGSAASDPLSSGTATKEKKVYLKPAPVRKETPKEVSPVVSEEKPTVEPTKTDEPEYHQVTPMVSDKKANDDEIFALGQFVDQFVKDGKIVMVHLENGKYKLTISADIKYEVVGTDLFQR
jgi:hypothetical protein